MRNRALIIVLAAFALLQGFIGGGNGAQAADVVKIGAPLALTGSLSDEAKKQKSSGRCGSRRSTPPAASMSAARR